MEVLAKINGRKFMFVPITKVVDDVNPRYVCFVMSYSDEYVRSFRAIKKSLKKTDHECDFMYEIQTDYNCIRISLKKSCIVPPKSVTPKPMKKLPTYTPKATLTRTDRHYSMVCRDNVYYILDIIEYGAIESENVVFKCKNYKGAKAAFKCYAHHDPVEDNYVGCWR